MEIFQIVGLALVSSFIAVLLRQSRSPESAMLISVVVGATIFLLMADKIAAIANVLKELAGRAQVNSFYLATIFKIIGIAYTGEFGAQVCRDAGENAVASKVEFAAKILIIVLAVPIIVAILETIIRLLP